MTKQLLATLAAILVMSTIVVPAQTSSTATPKKRTTKKATPKAHVETATERQIRELREQMVSQQSQIDGLKQQLADKDAKLSSAAQDAQAANTAAAAAAAQAQSVSTSVQANADAVTTLNSTVSDIKASNVGFAQTLSDTKKDLTDKIESPTVLHYKGVTITPGGFFALESVYRTRALNADINTPFNATPFPGAGQAHTSEYNISGRPSRPIVTVEGNVGQFKLKGYFEADFQSAGVTSNNNQSNSYTLRQRQFWGQAAMTNGFTVTGGQMWSLVTETKKGTDTGTENTPLVIDHQYNVGFSWARQGALRLQQKFGIATVAASLENAQIIYSASNANNNFFIGNAGASGGLYNFTTNYSSNVAPDVIVKAAFDPKVGHYEIGGIARFFRDRYYPGQTNPTPSAAGAVNDTKTGGGVFANARFPVTHYVDLGLHGLAGTGVGRYGTTTLPDVTVHPNGTLAPIKAYQGLFSVEVHPTKKLDLFGYAGGEYAQRTVYLNTLTGTANFGKLVGYAPPTLNNSTCNTESVPTVPGSGLGGIGVAGGAPYDPGSSCGAATRAIFEGTAGYVYRMYTGPRGRIQYSLQYSYLTRSAWTGIGGAPKATNNMVFTSMRYYLP